ncbi:MAG: class I SAM-dependent methyltransferase [Nitrospirales bacterium]
MSGQLSFTRQTIEAYETHQDLFLQEWNTWTYKVPPHLNDLVVRLPKSGSLLDLGCGPGQDTRYLRRQGFYVYGVDLTWSFLLAAKTRSSRLPVVQADMQCLPFSHQVFDGIWAAASVIHLPKSRAQSLFKKLFTLTKPGGWLAITVMYGREVGVLKDQWIPGRYLAKWFKSELCQTVRAAKWEVVSLERVKNQERKGAWLNLLAKRPL